MGWANSIINNFWAKLISLILAIATWFYVFDMVNSDSFLQKEETVEDIFSRYKFVVKEVTVKPVFFGTSPKGYRMIFDEVKVDPSRISIFGPKDIVKDVEELKTDRINVGEYTRSVKLSLGLHSNKKLLQLEGKLVDVYLPVVKVEVEAETKQQE